jgi:hypothetical protein
MSVGEPILEQSSLARILCGNLINDNSDINEVLVYLSNSVDNTLEEIISLKSLSPKKIALLGPFLGRSLLELGCTALIARLDPFRLLLVREFQRQPDYKTNKRNQAAINWQGDVLADRVNNLWEDKSLKNPTRALLGDYYTTLIWHKSFESFLDLTEEISNDEWMSELRLKDSNRLFSELKNEFSSLYSELSKGIHHELVIPLSSSFDRETTKNLIWRSIYNISTLGLIISVVSHALNKLDIQTAIQTYKEIQELEIFTS